MTRGLILLDRDGVLNEVVVDPEHGTIDSPLHPDQVRVYPWVPETLAGLRKMGYALAIVTNQPSAAKGKTTLENLEAVHLKVVKAAGAPFVGSEICFHRAEDGCSCRKPKPGMLDAVFKKHPELSRSASWMVGDGITDVEAGRAASVRTAYLGPQKCDARKILEDRNLVPDLWCRDLKDFAAQLAAIQKEKS